MELQPVGRLAFREEGAMWNAYWALLDTMQDAVFLGSIPMAAVKRNSDLKEWFMVCMGATVEALLPGVAFDRAPVPAPEHEKGGRA